MQFTVSIIFPVKRKNRTEHNRQTTGIREEEKTYNVIGWKSGPSLWNYSSKSSSPLHSGMSNFSVEHCRISERFIILEHFAGLILWNVQLIQNFRMSSQFPIFLQNLLTSTEFSPGALYKSCPSLSISSIRKSMSDLVTAGLEMTILKKLTLLPWGW